MPIPVSSNPLPSTVYSEPVFNSLKPPAAALVLSEHDRLWTCSWLLIIHQARCISDRHPRQRRIALWAITTRFGFSFFGKAPSTSENNYYSADCSYFASPVNIVCLWMSSNSYTSFAHTHPFCNSDFVYIHHLKVHKCSIAAISLPLSPTVEPDLWYNPSKRPSFASQEQRMETAHAYAWSSLESHCCNSWFQSAWAATSHRFSVARG